MNNSRQNEILKFINEFQTPETIHLFTNKCCYWFAQILINRFGGEIWYSDVNCHFYAAIYVTPNKRQLFDVTGLCSDVTAVPFKDYAINEPSYSKCIIRDSVLINSSDIIKNALNKDILDYEKCSSRLFAIDPIKLIFKKTYTREEIAKLLNINVEDLIITD